MLCKHCGCDNLEGTTICVFCGEAIDKSDGGISQIMTAFAGEAVSEAEEMTEEGGDIQLVSALHRLRKTDVGSSETLSEGESRVALDEARVLMQGASPALMSELAAEEAEAERLSEQAARIVEQAVAKIVSDEPAENASEEAEKAGDKTAAAAVGGAAAALAGTALEGAETALPEAEIPAAEIKPRPPVEVPASPLDFTMEELPPVEEAEELLSSILTE